jgi:hypothetical protein
MALGRVFDVWALRGNRGQRGDSVVPVTEMRTLLADSVEADPGRGDWAVANLAIARMQLFESR